MCGISGVISLDKLGETEVVNSVRTIFHRGPDEEGYVNGENFAFGMCRLAIIDVQGGHQPVNSHDGKVTAIFNGEIYNFKELRTDLLKRGYSFDSSSDSEVIIPMFLEYGINFPVYLQGMFAIAIYDSRDSTGYLIRDRLGKKPLWYSKQKNKILFSSELKGLLALGVDKEPNLENFAEYLQFGYINAPRSAYKSVNQVEPANLLSYSQNGIETLKYWNPRDVVELKVTYPEAKTLVHDQLLQSVQNRLISERPIGAFLSGGIDSSLVTALMTRVLTEKVHTFSIGFDDKKFDESSFSRVVAKHFGSIHHEKIAYPDPQLIVEKMGKVLDQPFADSSIIPTFMLSEFARQDVVVALGGDGGDEAFGGYVRYKAALFLNRINFLLAVNPSPILQRYINANPRIEKLLKHSKYQSLASRYMSFQSLIQKSELRRILDRDIIDLAQKDEFSILWDSIGKKKNVRKLQMMDLESYLPGDLLYKADMATMANSLELRSPFLDYRVVELGLSLPASYKIKNGRTKLILKDILAQYLPRETFERPKMGFGIPQAKWIRKELRKNIEETFFSKEFINRGWFNSEEVCRIYEMHKNGKDYSRIIWPIFMLELWARNWLDA